MCGKYEKYAQAKKKPRKLFICRALNGGRYRTRTSDILGVNQML